MHSANVTDKSIQRFSHSISIALKEEKYIFWISMICTETWNRTVYDKRRDFCFEVISMPFKSSNQPAQIGLNVFFSQLLRFARICTSREELLFNVGLLVATMKGRDFTNEELINTIKRLNKLYPHLINRIQGCTTKELFRLI